MNNTGNSATTKIQIKRTKATKQTCLHLPTSTDWDFILNAWSPLTPFKLKSLLYALTTENEFLEHVWIVYVEEKKILCVSFFRELKNIITLKNDFWNTLYSSFFFSKVYFPQIK